MIAQDRDLRTGVPVWAEYVRPRIAHSPLTHSIDTDITVIGAGISGAMLAEALSGRGMDVVVLDKRKPLSGSTSASTALLQYEIDTPLIHLSKQIGAAKAAEAWRRSKIGLESLAAKVRDLEIDCAFERRDSLYLNGNILDKEGLIEECRMRESIGLAGKIVSRAFLYKDFGIKANAALLSRDNIACNPVQLAAGFLKAAIQKGARLYTPIQVETLTHHAKHITLITHDGLHIRTRYVVFATGYEIPKYVKAQGHRIFSTWALSTSPVKGLPDHLPFAWQAADPYIYCRTTKDGRMIFGGEDEEFSDSEKRDSLIPHKQNILERKLRQLFPDYRFETEHMWAGSFEASATGLPSIGKIPGHKNCFAVMAYGGNGITFSRIAADIVAAAIFETYCSDSKLFSF